MVAATEKRIAERVLATLDRHPTRTVGRNNQGEIAEAGVPGNQQTARTQKPHAVVPVGQNRANLLLLQLLQNRKRGERVIHAPAQPRNQRDVGRAALQSKTNRQLRVGVVLLGGNADDLDSRRNLRCAERIEVSDQQARRNAQLLCRFPTRVGGNRQVGGGGCCVNPIHENRAARVNERFHRNPLIFPPESRASAVPDARQRRCARRGAGATARAKSTRTR